MIIHHLCILINKVIYAYYQLLNKTAADAEPGTMFFIIFSQENPKTRSGLLEDFI